MRYNVKSIKNMKIGLQEVVKHIDNTQLETGKELKNFSRMRPRELVGNWLICAVLNFLATYERFKICTDPNGGDGIIYDVKLEKLHSVEHVLVSKNDESTENTEISILKQIDKKHNKGKVYATGKSLIVFLNKKGNRWDPNNVAQKLPADLYFNDVWVVGLHAVINEVYIYNVTKLEVNNSTIWQVYIAKRFQDWKIERIK